MHIGRLWLVGRVACVAKPRKFLGCCGPPGPPLGITPNMQLRDLQPFLDTLARGQSIFDRKPWRDDLRVWEMKIKPEAIAEHRALQAVDLQRLSTQQLLHHLERCYANSHMAGALHGHFGAAFGTPLNHFLASCGHWTDCSARLLVDCVAGYSSPSVIGTNPPSVTMARAILNSPAAQQMLDACGSSDDAAAEHIIGLLQNDRVAGASVREWKDWVGNRLVDGHTGMATPVSLAPGLNPPGSHATSLEDWCLDACPADRAVWNFIAADFDRNAVDIHSPHEELHSACPGRRGKPTAPRSIASLTCVRRGY